MKHDIFRGEKREPIVRSRHTSSQEYRAEPILDAKSSLTHSARSAVMLETSIPQQAKILTENPTTACIYGQNQKSQG